MTDKKTLEKTPNFICEKCTFICSKKSEWLRHITTRKHENTDDDLQKNAKKRHICNCGKQYNHRQSLFNHKSKCIFVKNNINGDNNTANNTTFNGNNTFNGEIFMKILSQNSELQKQLIELSKDKSINNCNNTNTNCNNNKFNLNFYLNQTCKDALNITDFVSTLQLQVGDLEETGRLGFSEGISRIFINGLKQLDVTKRPVHCSDIKREVMYVKDDNQWNKEDADKQKLTNAIKTVANKNFKQLPQWQKENPTFYDPDSKANDKYMQIISESLSGSNKSESTDNYNKIIKNIAKQTIIEKESDN